MGDRRHIVISLTFETYDKDSCEIYSMETNTWNMTNVTLSEPKEISSTAGL